MSGGQAVLDSRHERLDMSSRLGTEGIRDIVVLKFEHVHPRSNHSDQW